MTFLENAKIHDRALNGFGKGKAEKYEAARPSYPSETLEHIRHALNGLDQLRVAEIACGTGKLTRALLAHPKWKNSIVEMKCVEPNEGMRAMFASTVKDPRVTLSEGTFDDTGVPDQWADMIVVAMAFHWCLELEATMKEFARILKPGGIVCFIWNPEDPSRATWLQRVYDVALPKRANSPSSAEEWDRWRQIFDLPVYKENFSEPEETTIAYTEPATAESLTGVILTWSGTALLPENEKEGLRQQIREIIRRGEELVWIDKARGIFEVPRINPVVIFRRVQRTTASDDIVEDSNKLHARL